MEENNIILNFICGVGIDNVDVVDLKTAQYIKKQGFNKPTHWYWLDIDIPYVKKGLKRVKMNTRRMNHNKYDECIYSAPTRSEITTWINSRNKNN